MVGARSFCLLLIFRGGCAILESSEGDSAVPTIEETLTKLRRSDFRAKFRLDAKDIAYIEKKGMETIRSHAEDFIRERLVLGASITSSSNTMISPAANFSLNAERRAARRIFLGILKPYSLI